MGELSGALLAFSDFLGTGLLQATTSGTRELYEGWAPQAASNSSTKDKDNKYKPQGVLLFAARLAHLSSLPTLWVNLDSPASCPITADLPTKLLWSLDREKDAFEVRILAFFGVLLVP